MKFKEFAGTAFIPTISRLVLAFAFITAGYNKLTTTTEFSPQEKTVLESHSVSVTTQSASAAAWGGRGAGRIALASFRQDEPAPADAAPTLTQDAPATTEDQPPKTGDEPDAAPDAAPAGDQTGGGPAAKPKVGIPGPVTTPPPPGEVYTARSLYRITLLCDGAGWPLPKWSAWLAATTEFLGGCLLLIGFLSRIWSLGLCIAMASAFYLVSMRIYGVHTTNPFVFAQDISKYNTVFNQIGLFVLSLGVLCTGPGPISLDRFIFRSRKSTDIVFDDDEIDVSPPDGASQSID